MTSSRDIITTDVGRTHLWCDQAEGQVEHEELKRICTTLRTDSDICGTFVTGTRQRDEDTERQVECQLTRRGEVQLVVEQRAVRQNSVLDTGLQRTLEHMGGGQTVHRGGGAR